MNEENTLHSVLAEETEHKTSGAGNSQIWNFDNVEEAKTDPETGPKEEEEKAEGGKKITDKAKRSSARVAVGMLDMLQKSIFPAIISNKYKKKFTPEEINAIDERNICDREKNELVGEDAILRNKWDRLMGKCMKKIEEVPLTTTEKDDLNEAFYTYFDFTDKTLPPEWFIGFAILNTVGKRVVDIVTD